MQLDIASEDEKRERDRLTHEAWGQRLTVAQFGDREWQLRNHRWARSEMTTWFLRGGDGSTLGSCETFRMESFLEDPKRPGLRNLGSTYGVASVYVEPALRGRGYATEMIRQLSARLRRDDPAVHAAILFSDVGAELYGRAGYLGRPAFDRVLPPEHGSLADVRFRLFGEKQLEERISRLIPPPERFVVWPTAAQLDWHLERERAYAALLDHPRPRFHGAIAGLSTIFWSADWKNERLLVHLFDALTASEAEALLVAARRMAGQLELREVRMWEVPLPFALPEEIAGGRIEPRDGSLPMIRPLHPDVAPEGWRAIPHAIWV